MADPIPLIISHATYVGASGATAAATYAFFSKDYGPPNQERYIASDIVKNQNGKFKYIYDNGPGFKAWEPFSILCSNSQPFTTFIGATAGAQLANLRRLWEHPGLLRLRAPEADYNINWAPGSLEQNFRVYPKQVGELLEYEVVVQFEEGA